MLRARERLRQHSDSAPFQKLKTVNDQTEALRQPHVALDSCLLVLRGGSSHAKIPSQEYLQRFYMPSIAESFRGSAI